MRKVSEAYQDRKALYVERLHHALLRSGWDGVSLREADGWSDHVVIEIGARLLSVSSEPDSDEPGDVDGPWSYLDEASAAVIVPVLEAEDGPQVDEVAEAIATYVANSRLTPGEAGCPPVFGRTLCAAWDRH